jgi:urease beta subunit
MKPIYLLTLFSFLFTKLIGQNTCSSALSVTAGNYIVAMVDGTELPVNSCYGSNVGVETAEWYTYTPTQDASLLVTTDLPINVNGDTRLGVYTGSCGSLTCVAFDDDSGSGFLSTTSFNIDAGVVYYIVFDNFWNANGFTFSLVENDPIMNLVSFTPVNLAHQGYFMAALDMNGDHLDDAISVNGDYLNINYQQSNGSFENVVHYTGQVGYDPGWSICAGDLDNNGYNDLVYAGGGASFIWANDEGTGYSETNYGQYIFCQRSNCVDLNADGNLDVFVCHDVAPNVYYMNDGNSNLDYNQGGLGDVIDGGNYGSVWIDYDNDCDMDLFIAKCRGGLSEANINQLHRNDGNGVFTDVSEESGLADNIQTWSSAWADFDNDGDMDVFVGASSDENGSHKLMRNNGDGTFTDATAGSGIEIATGNSIENEPGDFNNDGFVDVLGAGNVFLMNNGDMTFTMSSTNIAFGPTCDINNDGFLDILGTEGPQINNGNDNNYIKVNTVGMQSNKSGIGARVKLTSPEGIQIRDVRSGEGFRYCGSLNTHFGMGEGDIIESIEICWPSGIVDYIENPQVNSTITVYEGLGALVDETSSTQIAVFPNPANDILNIQSKVAAIKTATVFDLSGKRIMEVHVRNGQIDISGLAPGVYVLQVNADGQMIQHKITKK